MVLRTEYIVMIVILNRGLTIDLNLSNGVMRELFSVICFWYVSVQRGGFVLFVQLGHGGGAFCLLPSFMEDMIRLVLCNVHQYPMFIVHS